MAEPQSFLAGKVLLSCPVCGAEFTRSRSRLKHGRGKHCSPACQYEARRRMPKTSLELTCSGCGVQFERPPSWLKRAGGGKFCTRACRDEHWVGARNPNWQNGDGVYKRGSNWQAIRRRILARDKVCQHCGADGKLHVHHKIPFRILEDKDVANADWNLIALCPPCHRKEDARWKWVVLETGALRFPAGGAGWHMARERGVV